MCMHSECECLSLRAVVYMYVQCVYICALYISTFVQCVSAVGGWVGVSGWVGGFGWVDACECGCVCMCKNQDDQHKRASEGK